MSSAQHNISKPPRLPYLSARERAFATWRRAQLFEETSIVADDGVPLALLHAGDPARPTVLLVNALGVSCLFLAAIAERLARDYHVLTWESRGLPDVSVPGADADLSIRRHCLDARQVLAHIGTVPRAVVAYCSGVNVAVCAIAEDIVRAERLCLISPSVPVGPEPAQTEYQRKMLPVWEGVARTGASYAALVRTLLLQNARPDDGSLDGELAHLNNLPFHTDETTLRYARLQAECLRVDWPRLSARVRAATLVLHATQDDMIHFETSRAVARSIAAATLHSVPGGHFAVYTCAELHAEVAAFVGDSTRHTTADRRSAERPA